MKLAQLASHYFRGIHQCRQIRTAKKEMGRDEIIIHVDFSESYSSKYVREVQAVHFGYRHHITIHQGVCYQLNQDPVSFVTLSDDKRKTAEAIAAHINVFLMSLDASIKKVGLNQLTCLSPA